MGQMLSDAKFVTMKRPQTPNKNTSVFTVHTFWEDHKNSKKKSPKRLWDFSNFCGLLKTYELKYENI